MNLVTLQQAVAEWSEKNFGTQEAWKPLLGVGEELGELNHAYLKMSQKIRQNENHEAKLKDAVGDIVIYLADFCASYGISLDECVTTAWNEVSKRDWTKETGV